MGVESIIIRYLASTHISFQPAHYGPGKSGPTAAPPVRHGNVYRHRVWATK